MKRFRRSRLRQIIIAMAAILLVIARLQGWLPAGDDGRRDRAAGGLPPGSYAVERVVDGDTILVGDHQRCRLQGIDCPEVAHDGQPAEAWGNEATNFTDDFVRAAGRQVTIEVDGETIDHHGRWLVFVWSGDRLLNDELVRNGLAYSRLGYDYSQAKKDRLRDAQLAAQRRAVGIWSDNR